MMEKMRNAKKRKGFTLIELIVVIVILGILAAIAIPRFMSQTDNAKNSAGEATARTLNSAVALYMVDEAANDAKADPDLDAATDADGAYQALVEAELVQGLKDETILNDSAVAGKISYNSTNKLFTYTTIGDVQDEDED